MKTVECGIKAFDIHELLCHFVAKRGGFYAAADLDVRLVDTTFTPDDRLPDANYFQVACGAAFLSHRSSVPFRIFFAGTTRPMFWLHAAAEIEAVEQLAGKRIASYPPLAPPYWFNRIALRNHGLDPDNDVEMIPVRDDVARLGLLREGAMDAALISSAISPVTIQRLGLNTLTLLGDEITFVTTGIATTEKIAREDPTLVEGLVSVYRRCLAAIHHSPTEIYSIIEDVMGVPREVAEKTYELILPCYTPDGYMELETLQAALNTLSAEQGADVPINADELYDFHLTGK